MSGNPDSTASHRHPGHHPLFIAVAALVAFRLTSGAKTDRVEPDLTVGTMAPSSRISTYG